MELLPPISASLGAMVSLAGKLDALQPLDTELKDEVMKLKSRLLKLSKAPDPPATVSTWMNDVRELSYDMDNCADAGEEDWIDQVPGFKARAKEANGRFDRYIPEIVPSPTCVLRISDHRLLMVDGGRKHADPAVTGLHGTGGPVDRLIQRLSHEEKKLIVVPILGAGGIGKTTLVKQIWRHNKLGDFDCRAFVRTAKKPDMRRILRSILAQVRPHQPPDASDVHDLIHDISEHLKDKRYLLIIDDLWATSVWDIASRAFPEGNNGSRIITTTEIEDVALACCSYQSTCIFEMVPLCDSQSKELFTSAVFRSGEQYSSLFEEVTDEIIRRCAGLPQAIISMSSVLASQGEANTVHNREQILNSLPTNTTSSEILKQVLKFCYNCLPSCLQTCLLYLSLYPENYIILKEDIVKQWVSEGFILAPTENDRMKVAGSYFDKLVNMGLIQHIDVGYSDEIVYYAVHHRVHDLITSNSIKENFVTVMDYSQRTVRFSNNVSRLSLQFGSARHTTSPESTTTGLSQVRSLAYFGLGSCWPASVYEFKLLRSLILHIWADKPRAGAGVDLRRISELLLLRYLQVACNDTVHLPHELHVLKELETADINATVAAVPSDIFHLLSLLHLRLGAGTEVPDVTGILKTATLIIPPFSLDESRSPPICSSVKTIHLLSPICRIPKWIEQLTGLCILKIVVRELRRDDITKLQGLPALTVLSLHVQQRTREQICFATGAFAPLVYFEFRCGVLNLVFEEGAMACLQRLKLGFNAHSRHRGEQYGGLLLVGIEHLSNVQEIDGVIGGAAGADKHDLTDAETAFKNVICKHHYCNVSIRREDMIDELELDPPPEVVHPPPVPAAGRKQWPTSSESSIGSSRDHIHHGFPPTPDNIADLYSDDDCPINAFQRHTADLLLVLLPPSDPFSSATAPEILSLDWTRHLLESFLVCLEEFRSLLFNMDMDTAALARPPLDRILYDFLDRAVKALDLCNALRDGLNLLRQWSKHLTIAAAALPPSSSAPLGMGQIRRARKTLAYLSILMLDDKDAGGGQQNRSFRRAPPKDGGQQLGRGHHRPSSSWGSGSGSDSSSSSHFGSWSASRQLEAIRGNLPVVPPAAHDVAATGGLATAIYTMGAVLFVTAWALVAAIPCQGRGLQAHFAAPRGFPWASAVNALYERVLEESKKKERKHSCGLLKEIYQIERRSRQIMEITDAAQLFPLDGDKDAEVREAAQELVQVCKTLKDGLDPVERQVREMFHRIVRTRTEILDRLSRPNNPTGRPAARRDSPSSYHRPSHANAQQGPSMNEPYRAATLASHRGPSTT